MRCGAAAVGIACLFAVTITLEVACSLTTSGLAVEGPTDSAVVADTRPWAEDSAPSWDTTVLVDSSGDSVAMDSPDAAEVPVDSETETASDTFAADVADVAEVEGGGTCAVASIVFSPPSPSAPGAAVNVTAYSSGCGATPEYRFYYRDATGWTLFQNWNTSNTALWPTAGRSLGTYDFEVDVRPSPDGLVWYKYATYELR